MISNSFLGREPNKNNFFIIAHNIRSLFNVGSIFRTADAFNVTKIFLTGYTGRPDNSVHISKIEKVALGAEKFVPWEYNRSAVSVIKKLKKDGTKILALENNILSAIDISSAQLKPIFRKNSIALILGEERNGVNKKILSLCDYAVEIPMYGKKESLNVSVAFGIAAFCIRSQIHKYQKSRK